MSNPFQIRPPQILVAGATGLIGVALVEALLQKGYSVMVLARSRDRIPAHLRKSVGFLEWRGDFSPYLTLEVKRSYAVVNLAGEGIAEGPWTRRRRLRIIRSRLGTTRALAKSCQYASEKPKVFIQASAIGYYPSNSHSELSEDSPPGQTFLSRLVADWEAVANHEVPNGIRLVVLRTGVVLSPRGGMLKKFLMPIKFNLGAWFGSGKQLVPWVHIQDQVNAIVHLLSHPHASGPYNIAAPATTSQRELAKAVAKRVKRIAWCPIPATIAKWALGAMANEVLLSGYRIDSGKLVDSGFAFKYTTIGEAVEDLMPYGRRK